LPDLRAVINCNAPEAQEVDIMSENEWKTQATERLTKQDSEPGFGEGKWPWPDPKSFIPATPVAPPAQTAPPPPPSTGSGTGSRP